MTAANGPPASIYMAFIMWGSADHVHLLVWWLLLATIDVTTIAHTSLFLRRESALKALDMHPWRVRQIALQASAGLVWGGLSLALPQIGAAAEPSQSDFGLVLMAVDAITIHALLPFRKAIFWWTVGVWFVPMFMLAAHPSWHHLQWGLGVAVLVTSLTMHFWKASRDFVEGIEKRFQADALAKALQTAAERIHHLATRDELTGVFNRRHGMQLLNHWQLNSVHEQRRMDGSLNELGLLLLDIDFFKRVNDGYGHPAGDAVLREVSLRLQECLRDSDVLARIGGEEFMVLLPRTALGGAFELAERLRVRVAEAPVQLPATALPITISVGVTKLVAGDSIDQAIARADAALYSAKGEGRNRVVVAA